MAVYTRTGDDGTTGNLRGRMEKTEQLTETLGAIDELNSWIGYVRTELERGDRTQKTRFKQADAELRNIQDNLMTVATILAGGKLKISKREVSELEKLMDREMKRLPKLTNFIFPAGQLQVARAVARRAERETVRLIKGEEVLIDRNGAKIILAYMNRLSDALFILARVINYEEKRKERVWKKIQK
jgi:cob(I)alamin adenosyltransferase